MITLFYQIVYLPFKIGQIAQKEITTKENLQLKFDGIFYVIILTTVKTF